jgi:hypothetical protein
MRAAPTAGRTDLVALEVEDASVATAPWVLNPRACGG